MAENNGDKTSQRMVSKETMQMVWLLLGGGVIGTLYLIIRRTKNIFSWIIPVGMMAAGIDLFLKERQERIEQTGDQIIAQLDELDPIARAQVVKYLADQQIAKMSQ